MSEVFRMMTRRETLKGVALFAVADKLTDGGFAAVSMPGEPERKHPVLPPGAMDGEEFSRKCIACGLCAAACNEGVIRLSSDLSRFGQPELDFRRGSCLLGCVRCAAVCPVNALFPVQKELKSVIRIGRAVYHKDLCVRCTEGDDCRACERKCPVQAVHIVKGIPVVDDTVCIGCGACEHSCPARPMPAISVEGYKVQKMIRPVSQLDLISEMKHLAGRGDTLIIARGGVIKSHQPARGIAPLYEICEKRPGELQNAVVYDKIVGRAAASLYRRAKISALMASVITHRAAEMLENAGVRIIEGKRVETIINRENTGDCPMECAVAQLEDDEKIFTAIGKTLERMNLK